MTGLKLFVCSFLLLFSFWVTSDSLRLHRLQHTKLPCPSLSPGVYSNSCPLRFHELSPARLLCPWDSTGKNTGVGWHSLLQRILPTQGSNSYLLCLLQWKVDSLPVAPPTVREALTVESSSSSVSQSCLTLCDSMDCSMPGFPVHHQLLALTQTHVHCVSDAIQPSHSLSSPSPTFNLSQHQGLFQWVASLSLVAKVLEFQLQH